MHTSCLLSCRIGPKGVYLRSARPFLANDGEHVQWAMKCVDITAVMTQTMLTSSSNEQESTLSPGHHNLWSGKQPLHEAPTVKRRKATTSPRHDCGISIRDSTPLQRRKYISRAKSEDDDLEDRVPLSLRARQQGAASPLMHPLKVLAW